MSLSEEETRQFLKNEERLWDLAAITAASSICAIQPDMTLEEVSEQSYDLADALMAERRRRFSK